MRRLGASSLGEQAGIHRDGSPVQASRRPRIQPDTWPVMRTNQLKRTGQFEQIEAIELDLGGQRP